jgi:hypothetical protein
MPWKPQSFNCKNCSSAGKKKKKHWVINPFLYIPRGVCMCVSKVKITVRLFVG